MLNDDVFGCCLGCSVAKYFGWWCPESHTILAARDKLERVAIPYFRGFIANTMRPGDLE